MTIVKLMSRKRAKSAGQLLAYMEQNEETPPWKITWNLPEGASLSELSDLFVENEKGRIRQHKDAVEVSHEILSWSGEDVELTPEKMRDITMQYIASRAPTALVVAVPHFDTDTPHVHLAFSGVDMQGQSIRLSWDQLTQLKLDLEEYQHSQYPELISMTHHGQAKEAQLKINDAEYAIKRRNGLCRREIVQQDIEPLFDAADSEEAFLQSLKDVGFESYTRGSSIGIVDPENGRKYRLSRLGFDLSELSKDQDRLDELNQLRQRRSIDSPELDRR